MLTPLYYFVDLNYDSLLVVFCATFYVLMAVVNLLVEHYSEPCPNQMVVAMMIWYIYYIVECIEYYIWSKMGRR